MADRFHARRWLVLVTLLAGCSSGLGSHLPAGPFKAKPDKTSYKTPSQRLTELEALAAEMPSKSAGEHEQLAQQLGQQIRQEQDRILREAQVRALAANQSPTAKQILGAALQDPDVAVRIAAVEAIASQGGPNAVQRLGVVLEEDGNVDVQLAAARALGELKDPGAMGALATALESPDPALQYRAMQSLKSTTGQDFGDDVSAWRQYAQSGQPPKQPPVSFAESLRRAFSF